MSEILVRIVDKDQPDPELALMASKRGDVIAVCPDGWAWTPAERTNPDWRIIRCPILPSTAAAMLAGPLPDEVVPQKVRRTFKIDLDALPNAAEFVGPSRKDTIHAIPRSVLQAATVKKP